MALQLKELMEIAQECRKHLLSLRNRGEGVCNNYVYNPGSGWCKTCQYTQYSHLCKRILAVGFEFNDG